MGIRSYNRRIRGIAMLRAIGIARAVMAGGLIVTCALQIEWMMQSSTPWIILVFLLVVPYIADCLVAGRKDDKAVLPQLSKKFRYNTPLLCARLVTYVMTVALMLFWQYNLQQHGTGIRYMLPVLCVMISAASLLAGVVVYSIRIRKLLECGEL